MRTFLDIANTALGRIGEEDLTAASFNTSNLLIPSLCRTVLLTAYRELAFSAHPDFRETFTFPTVIGQNEYSLSFPFADIDQQSMRIIKAGNNDQWLAYIPESNILQIYPDVSDLPSGEPVGWWIKTGASESTKYLAFDMIPDAVYTILGIKKLNPDSITSITATDTTLCNAKGDRHLEDYLIYEKRFQDGQITLDEKETRQFRSKSAYLASNTNQGAASYFELPKQEGRSLSLVQTKSGRYWLW